ncbi:MAG: DUF484 family protein [Gammaproteobacteria bacterium]|nr:DUF484 family protein [Gammaproteobacteria bacterium]MDH5628726.1 DUF484 family protein [Gammaproteobacteria bacterium]
MKISNPQLLEEVRKNKIKQLMDEAQVKDYLANHPDFLKNNPQLLAHMEFSTNDSTISSLVEHQIKVLRERNQSLQGQLIEMLRSAHNNEELLLRCNQFMLDILEAKSLKELSAKIINALKKDFDLDGAALVLVGEYKSASAPAQIVSDAKDIKAMLNCHFPDNQTLCGRLGSEVKVKLFGDMGRDLQSFALVPLGDKCESGLLALASKEVDRFEPHMGTLFVELIAKLVEHLTDTYKKVT